MTITMPRPMIERYIISSKVSSSTATLRPEIAMDENATIAPSIQNAARIGSEGAWGSVKIGCPSEYLLPLAGLMCKIKPMRFLIYLTACVLAAPVEADDRALEAAVYRSFDDMPRVARVDDVSELCGAAGQANGDVIFCTTKNVVYLRGGAELAAYKLAHVMGHAVQVGHGIADIALREIRRRPDDEIALRGLVTRQVECIAGFLTARAGLAAIDLSVEFTEEPFVGSHWGRNPLRIGPRVSIGTQARAKWYAVGYRGDIADCAVGEMGSELLVEALRP